MRWQVTLLLHGRIGRLLLRDGIGRAAGFGQRDVQGIERVVGLLECCQRFRATVATLPQLGTQALELEAQATATPTATKAITTSTISIADIDSAQQTQSVINQNRDQSYPATHTDHSLPCRQISLRAADAKTLALPAGADGCYDVA